MPGLSHLVARGVRSPATPYPCRFRSSITITGPSHRQRPPLTTADPLLWISRRTSKKPPEEPAAAVWDMRASLLHEPIVGAVEHPVSLARGRAVHRDIAVAADVVPVCHPRSGHGIGSRREYGPIRGAASPVFHGARSCVVSRNMAVGSRPVCGVFADGARFVGSLIVLSWVQWSFGLIRQVPVIAFAFVTRLALAHDQRHFAIDGHRHGA